MYTGGIFKFTIMFPPHYPSVPPKLRFTSEIYHPLITDHGDFSLRPMGKWIPSQMFTTNVLHFVKHSFKKKGLESLRETWCVNPDAFRLYFSYESLFPRNVPKLLYLLFPMSLGFKADLRFRDKPDVFANQARQCAILSTSSSMLYDTPGQEDEDSALRFRKITKDEHADVLRIVEGMSKRKGEGEQGTQGN